MPCILVCVSVVTLSRIYHRAYCLGMRLRPITRCGRFRRTNPAFGHVPSRLAKKMASDDMFNCAVRVCSPIHPFCALLDMLRRYYGPYSHEILPECTGINLTFFFMALGILSVAGMWPRSQGGVLGGTTVGHILFC